MNQTTIADLNGMIRRLVGNLKDLGMNVKIIHDTDDNTNNLRLERGAGYHNLSIYNTKNELYKQIALTNEILELLKEELLK